MLLGEALFDNSAVRARTVHTPGGNAACWLAGRLLESQSPDATLWLSDPTWGNHISTFRESGVSIDRYPWRLTPEHALDGLVTVLSSTLAALKNNCTACPHSAAGSVAR